MLKKLEITDFEAHKNTTLSFGPGLNVIHGKSNNGKSASLRALELAAYGVWAAGENKKSGINGPVRVGAKAAEVKVESDKGKVYVRRGGSGINEWKILNTDTGEEFEFTNPGAGAIPQAQDVLGLRSVEIAGMQIRFNWSDQRDKHFLIDEVEGKSSSPSFVAGVLDEVGGLSGCEDLVRELAADKGAFEKAMKDASEKTQQVEEELEKFSDLENEIARYLATEKILNKAEEMQKEAEKSIALLEKIKLVKTRMAKYEDLDEKIAKTEKVASLLDGAQEEFKKFQRAVEISSSFTSRQKKNSEIQLAIEKFEELNLPSIFENRDNAENLQKEAGDIRKIASKIRKIQERINSIPEFLDFRKAAQIISKAEDKINALSMIINMKKQISEKINSVIVAEKKLDESNKEHEGAKNEYDKLIESLEVCPTCGQEITAECKVEMMEGV